MKENKNKQLGLNNMKFFLEQPDTNVVNFIQFVNTFRMQPHAPPYIYIKKFWILRFRRKDGMYC